MGEREPLHVSVPLWLPEEALEHYRDLVLAIGAMWLRGEWWLPFYVEGHVEVYMPVSMWLLERRSVAESLISQKESSLSDTEQKGAEAQPPDHGPVNLDDTQEIAKGPPIEDGPVTAAGAAADREMTIRQRIEAAAGDKEAEAAGLAAGVARPKSAHGEEAFKNAALAAGINKPCQGCPDPDPEMEVVDGVADAEPPKPRDHAEGRPQRGIASDPNPIARGSGLRASQIASIAYDAVQSYKDVGLGRPPGSFRALPEKVQSRISGMVANYIEGISLNAASMHECWKSDQLRAGRTVEQDPRLGQAWLEMDPPESRKGLIFISMVNALVRSI